MEEKKGNDGSDKKNGGGGGGGADRGKKNRGGINGSVLKEKESNDYGDFYSWDY